MDPDIHKSGSEANLGILLPGLGDEIALGIRDQNLEGIFKLGDIVPVECGRKKRRISC